MKSEKNVPFMVHSNTEAMYLPPWIYNLPSPAQTVSVKLIFYSSCCALKFKDPKQNLMTLRSMDYYKPFKFQHIY